MGKGRVRKEGRKEGRGGATDAGEWWGEGRWGERVKGASETNKEGSQGERKEGRMEGRKERRGEPTRQGSFGPTCLL